MTDADIAYPPLGTLKGVAENLWVIDGPVIRFGMPWPKMPFPTRTTLIRLSDGALFVHSPTPLSTSLKRALDEVGTVRWIVGPNRLHYYWIPEWHDAYPEAKIYLAPKIAEQSKGRIRFASAPLDAGQGYPWDDEVATLPIVSRFMTEVEFFHRPTRTLILTDLIENFEAAKLSGWMRLFARLGGVVDPHGSTPRDLRVAFRGQRPALKTAVETMIAWNPARIILAHGRWYESDGQAELRRALHWALR